ncbi:brachyurin-like isoform X2 [Agrilus planipennis]|uniref:Brachyurin-like isoform X2 n=1 Tax=Agrilus planipennis TaxID=224129 RepID=A0A7F5R371_AGRPL|nr:brachyurin-like isoform X2 [Agrilus planipennis]
MKIFYCIFFILSASAIAAGRDEFHTEGGFYNRVSGHRDDIERMIINGQKADIKDYPYQVILYYNNYDKCGGSIIAEQFILTAAHCLQSDEASKYMVKAGVSNIDEDGQERKAVELFIHEDFSFDEPEFDIAIVQVDEPFEFSNAVRIIKLPNDDQSAKAGDIVTVTGFGLTHSPEAPGNETGDLYFIDVPIASPKECSKHIKSDKMICIVSNTPPRKGTCYGDSGGPMMKDDYLVGIVSLGFGCDTGEPEYFTSVTYFLQWIRDIIPNN